MYVWLNMQSHIGYDGYSLIGVADVLSHALITSALAYQLDESEIM